MRVLYHYMPMPPPMPECVAELQEIDELSKHFEGELHFPNPNISSPVYMPRLLFGFHQLQALRALEVNFDLHHVYNPDPFPYPFLRLLKRPIVYSIAAGVDQKPFNAGYFNRLAGVQVADEVSLTNAQNQGVNNGVVIRPGIDFSGYSVAPALPLGSTNFRLLMASAPWTYAQFRTKGIDALLAAAQQDSTLEIIFLWRGVLEEEMRQKIATLGLASQITLITEQVDVNQMLSTVHAAVALSETVGIMKAYPHSLLDSMAAGRPVLTNRAVPISQYVAEKEVGIVMDRPSASDILAGVEQLKHNYDRLRNNSRTAAERDFGISKMIQGYESFYSSAIQRMAG